MNMRWRHAALLVLCAAIGNAWSQTAITVANHSFEIDPITGENAPAFVVDLVPNGWTRDGQSGVVGLLAPNATGSNQFYPGTTAGFAGSKVMFQFDGASGIRQDLSATLLANTRYTIALASGTRGSAGGSFAGYDIRLETLSGALVGQWIGANNNLAPVASFANTTRTFVTGPAPAGLGEKLRIRLLQASPGSGYTDLDNVRVTYSPATPHAAGTPIDVVIVAGQSNAMGWSSNAAQLSAGNRHYADAPDTRALLGYRFKGLNAPAANVGSIGQLATQGSGFDGHFDGFGPELSMGSDLAIGTDRRIAIIKYTVGAAGLEQNFKKTNPTGQPLYGVMISHIETMLTQLRNQGYVPRLRAMFWLQGETDALYGSSALYASNIRQFMSDVRDDTGAPWLQFYLTELNRNMPALTNAPGATVVNQALASVASEHPCDVQVIPVQDIKEPFADSIHYNANQSITIGQRWAAAYLARNP